MTELRIRIDKYLESDGTAPPRVPARIYAIDPSTGSRASTEPSLKKLIPISHRPEDAEAIVLNPGDYYVETVLPDGDVLSDSISLTAGKISELVLRAEQSPHEWLSWQHLVGNVSPTAPPEPEPTRPVVRSGASKKMVVRSGRTVRSAGKKGGAPSRFAKRALPFSGGESRAPARLEASIGLPISVMSLGDAASPVENYWEWLGGLVGNSASDLVAKLIQGKRALDVPADSSDEQHAVYRITLSPSSNTAVHVSSSKDAKTQRHFAIVSRRRCVELLALPIPWKVIRSGREASIEIVTRQASDENTFCASASARDEDLGMLLGYLSSGLLPTVRDMAETAQDMLFRKWENPYAACAGGYALVGTARATEDREWHAWISNLMSGFPDIPDGAIQWGQLRLKTRRAQKDIEEARTALKLAYRRGLPFYSLGMRWLMEGLEWLSQDDPEATKMLENVRRLAWRTNFQQPFTILKIGGA